MPEHAPPTRQLRVGPKIPISKIHAVVAANLEPARVRGNAQPNVLYRQVAMYLCEHVGGWSTTRIGRFYNGRDHSTVCYAIRRIESLRAGNDAFDAVVCDLMERCRIPQQHHPDTGARCAPGQVLDSPMILDFKDRVAERVIEKLRNGRPMIPIRHPPSPFGQ